METNAQVNKKASIQMRVQRAETGKWEDLGETRAVVVGLKKLTALKLKVLAHLLKFVNRVQSRLKEWQ
jgi:hypothetical protein